LRFSICCGVHCVSTGTLPFIDCDPLGGDGDPLVQQLLAVLYGNVLVAWNVGNLPVLTQWTPQQIENRKIYNTHLFSQGNEGHDFTAVLTDAERRALIEYMKTL
jgi:endo-cleaving rubber dioxygenase